MSPFKLVRMAGVMFNDFSHTEIFSGISFVQKEFQKIQTRIRLIGIHIMSIKERTIVQGALWVQVCES